MSSDFLVKSWLTCIFTLSFLYSLAATDESVVASTVLVVMQVTLSICGFLMFILLKPSAPGGGVYQRLDRQYLFLLVLSFFFFTIILIQAFFHQSSGMPNLIAYLLNALTFSYFLAGYLCRSDRLCLYLSRLLICYAVIFFCTQVINFFVDSLFGLKLYSKDNYSVYSGFKAVAGIFEHPSHLGIFYAYCFVLSLSLRVESKIYYYVGSFVSLVGAFLTQGRGGLLAITLVLGLMYLKKMGQKHTYMTYLGAVLGLCCLVFVATYFYSYLTSYFRLDQGSSGRLGGWAFAFSLISESPYIGHGYGSPAELTERWTLLLRSDYGSQIEGAGFHNSFINLAVEYGLPATLTFLVLTAGSLIFGVAGNNRSSWNVLYLTVVSLISMLFVGALPGGARLQTMLLTTFLGMAWMSKSTKEERL